MCFDIAVHDSCILKSCSECSLKISALSERYSVLFFKKEEEKSMCNLCLLKIKIKILSYHIWYVCYLYCCWMFQNMSDGKVSSFSRISIFLFLFLLSWSERAALGRFTSGVNRDCNLLGSQRKMLTSIFTCLKQPRQHSWHLAKSKVMPETFMSLTWRGSKNVVCWLLSCFYSPLAGKW